MQGTHVDDLELAEAALEGDVDAVERVRAMLASPGMHAILVERGATPSEADEVLGDMTGDCFGGERASGGLHRLLDRYNGSCPLAGFLRRVAINRLISRKRRQKAVVALQVPDEHEGDAFDTLPAPELPTGDAAVIDVLRSALVKAMARVDTEKLVVVRLIESFDVPQKRVGAMWGWHESKISRAKAELLAELRAALLEEIRAADPWLQLEWEDFLGLCRESVDLYAMI